MESEVKETMADFENELEASCKEFDGHCGNSVEEEGPDAEKWAGFLTMMQEKTVVKVKVKEAVKSGLVAYVDEIRGFIPASQISIEYAENLEEWVGKYLEVILITVDSEAKRLVLSAKAILKEKQEAEKASRLSACKVGQVTKGTVDSLKDYGAFINLESGLSGLLHISQISRQRIKHPGVVLKEGQKVTVQIIGIKEGKISLSMKSLESGEAQETIAFNYEEKGEALTGLGELLKGLKI